MHLCYIALELQFHLRSRSGMATVTTAARRAQPVALACVRWLHAYKQSRSCHASPEFFTRRHIPATVPIILKQEIRLKSFKEAEILRCALNCLCCCAVRV